MNPLAVYNAMAYDNRVDGTTMIIDLGAENTDLIIADADTIWLRSIPIGGNNFTETLVKSFKLNFPKAEDLKRNAATSKYARQIFQAMRPVFADLVAEVQRSIGFYASVHRDSRIKRILAVGGTFKLPGLQKYLQQNLQLDVERLDTLGAGAPPDPKAAATYQDNILSLVGAYGLALQAMNQGKITSSLLPARIKRERLWQEKQKYFAAAAALFVVGTGIGFGSVFLGNMSYDGAADARQKIQTIQAQANDLSGRWDTIQGAGATDRQRILNIRSLADYRDVYLQILADLHAAVPNANATPEQLKQTPRNQRKQILIDSIYNRYFPDMKVVTDLKPFATQPPQGATLPNGQQFGTGAAPGAAPAGMEGGGNAGFGGGAPPGMEGGAAPTPVEGATPGPEGRGFVITITGTTPMSPAAGFLETTLIKTLRDKLAKDKIPADKKYYIDRAEIVILQPLKLDSQKLSAIKTAYDAAVNAKQSGTFTPTASMGPGGFGGFGGGGNAGFGGEGMEGGGPGFGGAFGGAPAGAGGPAITEDMAYKDRRFPDEDIREDQEFVAVVTVVLDPPPKAPAAEGAAGAAPAAAGAEQPAATPGAAPAAAPGAAPATTEGAPATPAATEPGATPPAATPAAPGAAAAPGTPPEAGGAAPGTPPEAGGAAPAAPK
jgi:type IV pilus assembly protein PilM